MVQPPPDYDEDPRQQIIVREIKDTNGGYSKLKDAVFLAIVLSVGAIIWTMNQRLTTIEIMVKIIAKKSGVEVP